MPPPRTWTDEALRAAIPKARSWRDAQRHLDLHTTSVTRGLRRRADELGLDYRHFTGQRTWPDEELRIAIAESTTWAEAARRVGLSPRSGAGSTTLRRHVERLGLDTSHFGHLRSMIAPESLPIPFKREPVSGAAAGLSTAARWFLDRKYLVSVPLEPAPYDLIAESDDGLKRVQVANGDAMYLSPFAAVSERASIVLDAKYAEFKVS